MFNPKSVAIIGASPKKNTIPNIIVENFIKKFKGKIYLVNPNYNEINGIKCYKSVLEIEDDIDLAVVVVPAKIVLEVMNDIIKKNVKTCIIISGGFSEVGGEGIELENKLKQIIKKSNVRVLGPNCMGIYNAWIGVDTYFIPEERMLRPKAGPIALISQSGAVSCAILDWAASKGIGIGISVNYGNAIDVNITDLLEYFMHDDRIKVITIYLEGFKYEGEGRKFIEVSKKVVKKKPIIVYKAGRALTSRRAVLSHTAALAGNYEIFKQVFKQVGIIEVDSLEEMFDIAKTLITQPLPKGNRVLILTISGGMGVQTIDMLENYGFQIPEIPKDIQEYLKEKLPPLAITSNPIDLTGSAVDEHIKIVLESILSKDIVDIVIVIIAPMIPGLTFKTVDYLTQAKRHGKPIVSVIFGGSKSVQEFTKRLEENEIPVYETPQKAAKAIWALYQYSKIKESV